jgi:hypothetical protein
VLKELMTKTGTLWRTTEVVMEGVTSTQQVAITLAMRGVEPTVAMPGVGNGGLTKVTSTPVRASTVLPDVEPVSVEFEGKGSGILLLMQSMFMQLVLM